MVSSICRVVDAIRDVNLHVCYRAIVTGPKRVNIESHCGSGLMFSRTINTNLSLTFPTFDGESRPERQIIPSYQSYSIENSRSLPTR